MYGTKQLHVPDYVWDRVVKAVEQEFPAVVVTRFPDAIQDEDEDGYFLGLRN